MWLLTVIMVPTGKKKQAGKGQSPGLNAGRGERNLISSSEKQTTFSPILQKGMSIFQPRPLLCWLLRGDDDNLPPGSRFPQSLNRESWGTPFG
ncbi:unnamed protein product [Caretta caretta]